MKTHHPIDVRAYDVSLRSGVVRALKDALIDGNVTAALIFFIGSAFPRTAPWQRKSIRRTFNENGIIEMSFATTFRLA